MDKVLLQNIQINLSDKLQNYLGDLLKGGVGVKEMKMSEFAINMEKSDFGQHENKENLSDEIQTFIKNSKAKDYSESSMVRGNEKGQVYEKFLRDGKEGKTVSKEKLLSILDEIHAIHKQKSKDVTVTQQTQVMPAELKELEDRKEIKLSEDDVYDEESEDEGQYEEEDDSSTGSGQGEEENEDDGSMTLKEFKSLYLKN